MHPVATFVAARDIYRLLAALGITLRPGHVQIIIARIGTRRVCHCYAAIERCFFIASDPYLRRRR